jgi:uncharacterized protein (DUF1800 family)
MRESCNRPAGPWWIGVLAPLIILMSFSAGAVPPVDTDGDGIPDEIEPYEGTSPFVKDNDIFANPALFVKQQWRDFFGREVDPGGYAYWTGVIGANTVPRSYLAQLLLTGDEVAARYAPIIRLYLAFFRRAPDYAGLMGWDEYFRGGMPLEQISDGFALSAEFQATYGAKTNAEFLQLVYRNVLGRQPDPYGYNFWIGELDSGRRSRGAVMVGFSESSEFKASSRNEVLVSMAYTAFFRRTPDPSGFAGWVAGLDAGMPLASLVATFMNTVEYRDRFVNYYSMAATPAAVDAARFLTQATFGPKSLTEISRVQAIGYDRWLNEQFLMPAASQLQYMYDETIRYANGPVYEDTAYEAIWNQWLWGSDQLRGRMSFALSEILVISNIAPNLNAYSMAAYMDVLNRNAFGNFRTLMGEVTLNPAMGLFLNMLGNDKEDPAKGRLPNENYAREMMQLFTIGLVQLNLDGSPVIGTDGKTIPTYSEDVVKGFAKVYTGWGFAGNNTASNSAWFNQTENWTTPMVAWPSRHSTATKTLLNGTVLPGNQTPQQDLNDALDNIFWHPNVGPFICKELIQRFITSNPSRGQVSRCASVFNNNGVGERGNLAYVIRAILLDPEARDLSKMASPTWGKQREPVIRFANILRAFNARSTSGRNAIHELDSPDDGLAQSPLIAPSVFNFFSPFYRPPGVISQAGLVAPEFQITTETSVVGALNFFGALVDRGAYGWNDTQLTLDYGTLQTIAFDSGKLADHINMLLMAGAMSPENRGTIMRAVEAIPANRTRDRVEAALQLSVLAPDYVIQK